MDESFSPKSLRTIWDAQTRKGEELARFFPDVAEKLTAAREARRAHRSTIGNPALQAAGIRFLQTSTKRRLEAEALLDAALVKLSESIALSLQTKKFSWGLHELPSAVAKRRLFAIGDSPETYFADRQLQRIVRGLIGYQRLSRHTIVGALTLAVDDKLPKAVVKADVHQFYENIQHSLLLELVRGARLTPTTQSLVTALLREYADLTGKPTGLPTGLPTGVGLSAQLAELFIERIDEPIRATVGVTYYARYVDDIVVVFGLARKQSAQTDSQLIDHVGQQLQVINLALNPTKTTVRRSSGETLSEFEILGYKIERSDKRAKVSLTDTRVVTLNHRLNRSFELWSRQDQANHGRQGLLINRLRFLTGNTRLTNNKRNAMVGIYFSNPHLTELSALDDLDDALSALVQQSNVPASMRRHLDPLSFRAGFESRTLFRFTTRELKMIRGAWRD